ncbi:RNA-directed DNA polymerase, eukaryota, reverse transcriptase zinc-binding domain protein [Tanacetum coccineum]
MTQAIAPKGVNDEINEIEKILVNDEIVNGGVGDDVDSLREEFNVSDTDFPSLSEANKQNNEDCTNKELNVENVEESNNNIFYSKECNIDVVMVSSPNCACCVVTSKDDCCTKDCDDANDNEKDKGNNRYKTFANVIKPSNNDDENKLSLIPLCVEEEREVVIFDEELVVEGSSKWSLTLCGHFVGFKMTYSELRYNLVRMWGKFGLKEIVTENGWDPDVIIDRSDPKVLPCWIKLYNVPLEACTVKGISVIASGLGKPLIMDKTTTKMCKGGTGNFGYARVLVEIQADKDFKDKIEICYKSKAHRNKCSKFVRMEYSWKPPKCCECKVFGLTVSTCGLKSGNENDVAKGNKIKGNEKAKDGFRRVRNGIKTTTRMGNGEGQRDPQGTKVGKTRVEYMPVNRKPANTQTPHMTNKSYNLNSNKENNKTTQSPKRQLIIEDLRKWTSDMFKYFKEQREAKWMNKCPDKDDAFDEVTRISKRKERRFLWKDLGKYKRIIDDKPWVLMGDWNVSLHLDDHSEGGSCKTSDMIEFQECLEHIEVEDLNCLGIHFTWVQSRQDLKLQVIQKQVDQDPHNATLNMQEPEILKEYNISRKDEEKLLLQKAKIDWLSNGDKNNKFFHFVLKGRAHRIRIETVNDENEVRCDGIQVAEQFVNHFQNFLGKAVTLHSIDMGSVNRKIMCDKDAEKMIMTVSDVEIKDALFDICDNKDPGPDGYLTKFFKIAWSMIKKEVCDAIKEFFKTRKMLGELNATLSTFVPKSKIPKKASDYRPIACCNTIYKIINLQISHLCLADDLLVLYHGDLNSVKVVKKALVLFSSIYGLNPNIGKSTVFFGNVKEHVKHEILSIIPFKIGSLVVSYLGVPLITKHLTFTDCKSLIDKVKWKWPMEWNSTFSHILPSSVPDLIDGSKDLFLWETNEGKCNSYSTIRSWKDWRDHRGKVNWGDLVWFSNCTLKHSFIMWMAVQGRLTTQDRLMKCRDDLMIAMSSMRHNKSIKSVLRSWKEPFSGESGALASMMKPGKGVFRLLWVMVE